MQRRQDAGEPFSQVEDDSVDRWLADFDDAIVRGALPPLPPWDASDVQADAQQAVKCLTMLEVMWPRETASGVHDVESGKLTEQASSDCDLPERIGKFELLALIGEGAFGSVFLARDATIGRNVALKIPKPGGLLHRNQLARFHREAQLLARCNHAGIVSVLEAGEEDGIHFIASSLCQGPSLRTWLDERACSVSCLVAATIARDLAAGLAHAHGLGILHRDLKPGNILIDGQAAAGVPVVKLTDFGLARTLEGNRSFTRTGLLVGTAAYMSPEQAAGNSEIDFRSDIYSLGAVLYELLVGRQPHRSETTIGLLHDVQTEIPVLPRRSRAEIPQDLETICMKCLEKEPQDRYASANDVLRELNRFLEGKPISARRASGLERVRKWRRRQPLLAGLYTALAILVVSMFGATIAFSWMLSERNVVLANETERVRVAEEIARLGWLESLHLQLELAATSYEVGASARAVEAYHAIESTMVKDLDSNSSKSEMYAVESSLIKALSRGDFQVRPFAAANEWELNLPFTACVDGGQIFGFRANDDQYELLRFSANADGNTALIAAFAQRPTGLVCSQRGSLVAVGFADQVMCFSLAEPHDAAGSLLVQTEWRSQLEEQLSTTQHWSMTRDGDSLAYASGSRVTLFNVTDGAVIQDLDFNSPIGPIAFDDPGDRIALSIGNRVDIMEVGTGQRLQELKHQFPASVTSLAWNRAGDSLVCGREDFKAYVWNLECANEPAVSFGGHQEWVTRASFIGTDLVLTAGDQQCLTHSLAELEFHRQSSSRVLSIYDSGYLFEKGGQVYQAQYSASLFLRVLPCDNPNFETYSIALSHDDRFIAATSQDAIRVWSTADYGSSFEVPIAGVQNLVFVETDRDAELPERSLLFESVRGVERLSLDGAESVLLLHKNEIRSSAYAWSEGGRTFWWIDWQGQLCRKQWQETPQSSREVVVAGVLPEQSMDPDLPSVSCSLAVNDRVAVVVEHGQMVRLIDLEQAKEVLAFPSTRNIRHVGFSGQGRLRFVGEEAIANIDAAELTEQGLNESWPTERNRWNELRGESRVVHCDSAGRIEVCPGPGSEGLGYSFDNTAKIHMSVLTKDGDTLFVTGRNLKLQAWQLDKIEQLLH